MKKHIYTSVMYTLITAIVLGLGYPLLLTAVGKVAFPKQANGELIYNAKGELVGSALIGQAFTGAKYFHSRPSGAGTGYDAGNSSGSNLGPTSKALNDRVAASVAASVAAEKQANVPIDLVTTSASGLDPDITPAGAQFQVARVAAERGMTVGQVQTLVATHTKARQLGLLGEPRVNVLELNRALDAAK